MIHGLDTGFLVAAEVREHAEHAGARITLTQVLSAGDVIAIAPQVLAEFIHVVTDPRRFTQPLDMKAARDVAEQWWTASDVVQAFPDAGAVRRFSHGCSSSRWAASDFWIRSLPQLTSRQVSNRSSPPTSRTSWFSASLRASRPGEAARIPECVGSCDRAVVRTRGVAPPARMFTPCPALADRPACRTA